MKVLTIFIGIHKLFSIFSKFLWIFNLLFFLFGFDLWKGSLFLLFLMISYFICISISLIINEVLISPLAENKFVSFCEKSTENVTKCFEKIQCHICGPAFFSTYARRLECKATHMTYSTWHCHRLLLYRFFSYWTHKVACAGSAVTPWFADTPHIWYSMVRDTLCLLRCL